MYAGFATTAFAPILAAVLLPALPQAKQVACASQLRQVGLAFHDFAHDHDNRFPMGVFPNLPLTGWTDSGSLQSPVEATGLADRSITTRNPTSKTFW